MEKTDKTMEDADRNAIKSWKAALDPTTRKRALKLLTKEVDDIFLPRGFVRKGVRWHRTGWFGRPLSRSRRAAMAMPASSTSAATRGTAIGARRATATTRIGDSHPSRRETPPAGSTSFPMPSSMVLRSCVSRWSPSCATGQRPFLSRRRDCLVLSCGPGDRLKMNSAAGPPLSPDAYCRRCCSVATTTGAPGAATDHFRPQLSS
ncbi:hypothetical protein GGD56_001234 [Rhizobium mongolense]|uniref:Uncharacterized protein n=2 Tax=Rhizobium mongolense TaxID=57676 RepID=A0ABR6IHR3_9HYPH|nr:hypothetical protein [Rhizobium mongolense]TVZ74563.1 hypothetical protein BCL32_2960 [Rhizobium mongolense USDA 1844]